MSDCQKCLICYASAKPINELPKSGKNVNPQLTAFFLMRKLFEISNFTCTNLLKDHGNPSSWFVCCSQCFTTVRNAQVVFNQLMRIKHKWKTLKSTLEDQLLDSYNQEKGQTNSNGSDFLIREEICKRLENKMQGRKISNEPGRQEDSNIDQFETIKIELKEETKEYEDPTDESTIFDMEDIVSEISYNDNEGNITSNSCNSSPKGTTPETLNVSNEPTSYITRNGRLTKKPKYASEDDVGVDCIPKRDKKYNVGLNSSIQNASTTISNTSLIQLKDKYKSKIFRSKTLLKKKRIRKSTRSRIKSNKNVRPDDARYIWSCFLCRKRFTYKASLLRHRKNIHFLKEGPEKHSTEFVKSLLDNENPTASGIIESNRPLTPGHGVYKCVFCPKSFTFKSSLTRHRKNIHFPKDPKEKSSPKHCYEIDKSLLENENQMTARSIESTETPDGCVHPCILCGKRFKFKSNLSRHRTKVHFLNDPEKTSSPKKYSLNVDKSLPEKENTSSAFECRGCEKTCNSIIQRYEHENVVHGMKNQFVCILCKNGFFSEAGIKVHFRQIHASKEINASSKKFNCEHCGKMFISLARLKSHTEIVHENLRNFVCETCSRTFSQMKYLKFHQVREHNMTFEDVNLNLLSCEHCGKVMADPGALRMHIKGVHEKKHPFNCSVCNVGRFSQSAMHKHMMMSHSQERPEKCSMCTRSFINKKALDDHMNVHNNERPYKCQHCDRCLFSKKSLLRHEEIHKGEIYNCEFCDKTFPTKHYLRNHRRYAHKVQIKKSTKTEPQKSIEQNQI